MRILASIPALLVSLPLAVSCSAPDDSGSGGTIGGGNDNLFGGTNNPNGQNGSDGQINVDCLGDECGGAGTGGIPEIPEECLPRVVGFLRDFQAGGDIASCPVNADFQNSWQNPTPDIGWLEPGIAAPMLDVETKRPIFSGGSFTTVSSKQTFESWYVDDPLCNRRFEYELPMEKTPQGTLVFDSDAFFPLDGNLESFGNSGMDDFGMSHNFHFTFELHMRFLYQGGEIFTFRGDDDLFVFINNQLALDLGGVHAPQQGSISVDSLGLTPGQEYDIDFFHAERSTSQSNFRIETSLAFSNCEVIEPVEIVR